MRYILPGKLPLSAAVIIASAAIVGLHPSPFDAMANPARKSDAQSDGASRDKRALSDWERHLALEDEVSVQLAINAGVDPIRAEKMRAIFTERRYRRRVSLNLHRHKKIDDQELFRRARSSSAQLQRDLKEILHEKEYAVLQDRDQIRFITSQILKILRKDHAQPRGQAP